MRYKLRRYSAAWCVVKLLAAIGVIALAWLLCGGIILVAGCWA